MYSTAHLVLTTLAHLVGGKIELRLVSCDGNMHKNSRSWLFFNCRCRRVCLGGRRWVGCFSCFFAVVAIVVAPAPAAVGAFSQQLRSCCCFVVAASVVLVLSQMPLSAFGGHKKVWAK